MPPNINDDIDHLLQLARDELEHIRQDAEHDPDSASDYRTSKATLERVEAWVRQNA